MSSATLILSAFGDEVKRLDSSSGRVVLGRASAFTADRNAAFDNESHGLTQTGYIDSPVVSRAHAELEWVRSGADLHCTISDLGSTHGTSVIRNGTTIPLRAASVERLHDGDLIVLGKTVDGALARIDAVALRVAYEHRGVHVSSFGIDDDELMLSEAERDAAMPELDELASSDVDQDAAALKTSPIAAAPAVMDRLDVDALFDLPGDDEYFDELLAPVEIVKVQTTVVSNVPADLADDVTFALADGQALDSFGSVIEPAHEATYQSDRPASSVEQPQSAASLPPSSQPLRQRLPDPVAPSSALGKRARADDEEVVPPAAKAARTATGPSAVKLTTVAALGALGGAVATLVGLASLGSYLD